MVMQNKALICVNINISLCAQKAKFGDKSCPCYLSHLL